MILPSKSDTTHIETHFDTTGRAEADAFISEIEADGAKASEVLAEIAVKADSANTSSGELAKRVRSLEYITRSRDEGWMQPRNPVEPGDAVNKQYVDNAIRGVSNDEDLAERVGVLENGTRIRDDGWIQPRNPVQAGDAVNKQYVDNAVRDSLSSIGPSEDVTNRLVALEDATRAVGGRMQPRNPVEPGDAVNKAYIDKIVRDAATTIGETKYASLLVKTDSAGYINMFHTPSEPFHLANKRYVDESPRIIPWNGAGAVPDPPPNCIVVNTKTGQIWGP